MASTERLQETIEKLIARSVIPENEVNSLFQKAVDIEYWRTLSPGMGVMAQPSLDNLEDAALSSEQEALALAHLEKHGYFQTPALIAPAVVARMCTSIEALRSAGWPIIFSYVYDNFWAVLRTPSMVQFLSRKLGAGYFADIGRLDISRRFSNASKWLVASR
jgi:hypothetical protein